MAKCYMRWRVIALISSLIIFSIGTVNFALRNPTDWAQDERRVGENIKTSDNIHLVSVSCAQPGFSGQKDFERPLTLSITMMKSAAMFAKKLLHFHIFTEEEMKPMYIKEIESWPVNVRRRILYDVYSVDYSSQLPKDLVEEWHTWYKPCGSFRLFLPTLLASKTDAAIYSDSDVVYIKPIDELWEHLQQMSDRQVAGISPTTGYPIEVQDKNVNFIPSSSGNFQINSGVMLMNFTRMLNTKWKFHDDRPPRKYGTDLLLSYYNKFKDSAEHDQKLLNIIFHHNPAYRFELDNYSLTVLDLLYKLPCSWNFKNNFCKNDKNICEDAEANGAGAVHGISGSFFGNSNPTFKGLYETFEKYKLGDDVNKKLFKRYMAYLGAYAAGTYCGKKAKIIMNSLKRSLSTITFHE